jgi:hypothetical protein
MFADRRLTVHTPVHLLFRVFVLEPDGAASDLEIWLIMLNHSQCCCMVNSFLAVHMRMQHGHFKVLLNDYSQLTSLCGPLDYMRCMGHTVSVQQPSDTT